MLAAGGVEVVGGTVVDLGAYPNWESREAVFQLRNNGNVPIHLERVRPACTCAIVRQPPRSLPPNTVTELRVEMLAKSLNGAFTRYLYVQTDDPETPLLNLTITGTATPLVAVSPREYVYVDRLPLARHAWQFRLTPADPDVLLGDPYLAIARPPTLDLQFTRAAGGILALTVTLPAAPPPGDLECAVAVPVERPEGHAHVHVGITGKLGDELYCLPAGRRAASVGHECVEPSHPCAAGDARRRPRLARGRAAVVGVAGPGGARIHGGPRGWRTVRTRIRARVSAAPGARKEHYPHRPHRGWRVAAGGPGMSAPAARPHSPASALNGHVCAVSGDCASARNSTWRCPEPGPVSQRKP
jgi:hypothetical protein